jgi:hypothetical protein
VEVEPPVSSTFDELLDDVQSQFPFFFLLVSAEWKI